jgi:hypothetical protein
MRLRIAWKVFKHKERYNPHQVERAETTIHRHSRRALRRAGSIP